MKRLISIIVTFSTLFTLAACGAGSNASSAGSANDTPKDPSVQFVNALQSNFDSRLEWWSNASDVNDQALSKFITSIEVSTDDSFSVVTVTANAEIGGENADLGMGSLVGTQVDPVNGLSAAVYCAGKTYPNGDDTFNNFVKTMAVDFEINDEMKSLKFPTKGIVVKMIWNKSTVSKDKYGNESKKLSPIGTDQVGISTTNFEKISDAFSADYRKLSDIAAVTYARKSWHDGLCAAGQSANN